MMSYDDSKVKEMDEILNFMYQMAKKRFLDKGDVYNTLCYYGLKSEDRLKDPNGNEILSGQNTQKFFEYWVDRFKVKPNINVFVAENWKSFCQFKNGSLDEHRRYIKLYIPIDYAHIYDGANILFDFLARNEIEHLSKISRRMRVDNVIIRLRADDRETALKIINFINSNPYLSKSLNKPNPFVPTVNGIGYMMEHGNSYNSDIANYIVEYINQCKKMGVRNVSAKDFREFLHQCKKHDVVYSDEYDHFDDSLLATFEVAYNGKNKDLNMEHHDVLELTRDQKQTILIDALRATYQKYGMDQVETALIRIVKYYDYSYITNGGENLFRSKLRKNLTPDDVLDIINTINQVKTGKTYNTVNDKIRAYCMDLFANELPFELDEICLVTLEKYNEHQLVCALSAFVQNGDAKYFARYKGDDRSVNYRNKITKYDAQTIQEAMISSLGNKGVYAANLSGNALYQMYAKALSRGQVKVSTQASL